MCQLSLRLVDQHRLEVIAYIKIHYKKDSDLREEQKKPCNCLHQFCNDVIMSCQINDILKTSDNGSASIVRCRFQSIKYFFTYKFTVRQMVHEFQLRQQQIDFHIRCIRSESKQFATDKCANWNWSERNSLFYRQCFDFPHENRKYIFLQEIDHEKIIHQTFLWWLWQVGIR